MSQLKLDPTWILELSTPDLRLVLQALGGRLKPEHVEDARQLGDRLTLDRINDTQRYIDRLRENLERPPQQARAGTPRGAAVTRLASTTREP